MKLNSNSTNNIKTSKEKSKIFNFENGWSNVDGDSTYLKDREITNNKREFIIKELEIYRVI